MICDNECRELRELRSGGVRLIQETMISYESNISVLWGTLMRYDNFCSSCERL